MLQKSTPKGQGGSIAINEYIYAFMGIQADLCHGFITFSPIARNKCYGFITFLPIEKKGEKCGAIGPEKTEGKRCCDGGLKAAIAAPY